MLEEMLADVRYTYADISEALTEKGWPVSRSSIQRYAARTSAAAERIKVASEQTRVLVQAIKDGQDVEASEVGSALLLDGLIRRLATADEEFDELSIDKAGKLLVALQRSGVYKNRWKAERKKIIDSLKQDILTELRHEVQEDEDLLARLEQKVERIAQREAAKDE